MESWILILVTICFIAIFKSLFHNSHDTQLILKKQKLRLPPGPSHLGLLGWLGKNSNEIEEKFRSIFAKYGPIITVPFNYPTILVSSPVLAHQALIQNSAAFADRPKALLTNKIMSSNQHNISTAMYGPTWRILRRNISTFLHASRVKYYSGSRKQALHILIDRLKADSKCNTDPKGGAIDVVHHLHHAVFSLLSFMCYGEGISDTKVAAIDNAIQRHMLSSKHFGVIDQFPLLGKILFSNRLREFLDIRKDIENEIVPLIRARKQEKENPEIAMKEKEDHSSYNLPVYVDTLFEVVLEDNGRKRKLTEDEMVSLCVEFATAGGDTSSSTFLWIMANVVKYQDIQAKLLEEIKGIVGDVDEVNEEDLPKMPYLKGVILEALRRHPPGHFVLSHKTTEDVELGGYIIPKGATFNIMTSEIAHDPKIWDEPMKFKPERFLEKKEAAFDITGTREIKMMPFGAGRRICPAYAVAMLHLEYFVANLVLKFEWKPEEGDEIDMSEKHTPFILMEHPLRARIKPRTEQHQ